MDRLDTTLEKDPTIATQVSDDGCMHIEGLTVRNPEGKVFVEDAAFVCGRDRSCSWRAKAVRAKAR
jgi:hypothetical protein